MAERPDGYRHEVRIARRVPKLVGELEPELVALRRDIHAHPETAWQEARTTSVVAAALTEAAIPFEVLAGGTGLVAHVTGRPGGPVVALRADLDALPVPDEKDVPYRSTVPATSHACGHDVHTSALVGAARVLRTLAGEGVVPGAVRLLFQPAEEVVPGGALAMIDAGALEGVSRVFALHCDPRLDVGRVALRPGPITAATDRVAARLTGPGGHTARPHLTVDVVAALADVLSRAPTVLSRRCDPLATASLVWGQVRAGHTGNVIPDTAEASGTVRVFDRAAWTALRTLVPEIIRAIAAPYGAEVAVDYSPGVPPAVNDGDATLLWRDAVAGTLGPDAVTEAGRSMGGEDFAWMLDRVPGSLARLGVRGPGPGPSLDLHQGGFDVDERAIGYGATALASAALFALAAPPP